MHTEASNAGQAVWSESGALPSMMVCRSGENIRRTSESLPSFLGLGALCVETRTPLAQNAAERGSEELRDRGFAGMLTDGKHNWERPSW